MWGKHRNRKFTVEEITNGHYPSDIATAKFSKN